jgi:hypothetical protein
MKKIILTLILSLAAVFDLTACKKDKTPDPTQPVDPQPTEPVVTPQPTVPVEPTIPVEPTPIPTEPIKPETYTITFDSLGGSAIDSISFTDVEEFSKPADPTKEKQILLIGI